MDLRERVVRAWDASGDAEEVAATFAVSRAWVHRLVQRRRETGSIAPRTQTKFRARVLAGQEARLAALITAQPDATLAELREALPTTAALSTLWLEIDRLGLTVNKTRTRRRTTPTRRRRRASAEVRTAIEQVGAHVRFLPPYSPDFNPIELAFAKLKAFLRAARPRSFDQVCDLMAAALGLFTTDECVNYAQHCGYRVATA